MNCINGECVLLQVQVRFQSKLNRTGPVQFISTVKTERERDPEGTVNAATSSVCFLQNIRSMNQTSYLQSGPLLRLYLHPIHSTPPLIYWPNTITPLISPRSSTSPPLSLLIRPQRGRFFKGLWLPWWFSIKPLRLKEPSDFLKEKNLQIRIKVIFSPLTQTISLVLK